MDRLEAIEPVEREPRPLKPEVVTKILQTIPAFVNLFLPLRC